MSTRRRQLLIVAGATLATAWLAPSEARGDVSGALARIAKARADIRTLRASFEQTRIIGLLASEVKSTGKLTLVRPDRLRWDLSPPDEVTYWIGPEGLAMANSDGVTKVGKAAAGRFAAVLADLMVMLGGDMKSLEKRYRLEASEEDGKLVLTATPTAKDVKKHVAKLRLRAAEKLWQVRRIEIHEKNGDQSLIDFRAFVKNEPVEPRMMKPPPS